MFSYLTCTIRSPSLHGKTFNFFLNFRVVCHFGGRFVKYQTKNMSELLFWPFENTYRKRWHFFWNPPNISRGLKRGIPPPKKIKLFFRLNIFVFWSNILLTAGDKLIRCPLRQYKVFFSKKKKSMSSHETSSDKVGLRMLKPWIFHLDLG